MAKQLLGKEVNAALNAKLQARVAELKEKKKQGILTDTLKGKNVALIFEKNAQFF